MLLFVFSSDTSSVAKFSCLLEVDTPVKTQFSIIFIILYQSDRCEVNGLAFHILRKYPKTTGIRN